MSVAQTVRCRQVLLHGLLLYGNSFTTDWKIGALRTFFDHIRTLTTYLDFASWEHLMDFMMRRRKIDPYKEVCARKN